MAQAERVSRAEAARAAPVVVAAPAVAVVPARPAATQPPHPARPSRPHPRQVPAGPPTVAVSGRVAVVIAFALAQVGRPYIFGASGPYGYDCSGLVVAAYARVGVGLAHFTGAMLGSGRPVDRSQLAPGDLVFPTGGHVAIYLGGGRMVEAPHSGASVRVISVYSFYTARRIL